ASPISPIAHITFWTFDDVVRPQIFMVFSRWRHCERSEAISATGACASEAGLLRGVYPWARRRRDPRARNDDELVQPPGFLGQHDRDAVADRIGELGRARDQFLLLGVIFQPPLG